MMRKAMTKAQARAEVRAKAAAIIARERRLEDLAISWLLVSDKLQGIQAELDQVLLGFYEEGLRREEIAARLALPTGKVPSKAALVARQLDGGTDSHGQETEHEQARATQQATEGGPGPVGGSEVPAEDQAIS